MHTFSPSFMRFCKTPVGKFMGKKPLDVVLTIFCINKVIQLGCFVGFCACSHPRRMRQLTLERAACGHLSEVLAMRPCQRWTPTPRLTVPARLQSRPLLCPRLRADAFSDFYVIDFKSPFEMGFSWGAVTPLQWIWLVHALVVGQGFNTAIYRAIGKAGVYYGYRLDEPVPWVTGFPFSVVPHPNTSACACA